MKISVKSHTSKKWSRPLKEQKKLMTSVINYNPDFYQNTQFSMLFIMWFFHKKMTKYLADVRFQQKFKMYTTEEQYVTLAWSAMAVNASSVDKPLNYNANTSQIL